MTCMHCNTPLKGHDVCADCAIDSLSKAVRKQASRTPPSDATGSLIVWRKL